MNREPSSNEDALLEELQNCHKQFLAIRTEAEDLLRDLTETQFHWQPSPERWSIAQCIDHLVVTGRNSLSNMHRAIEEARAKGRFSRGPFRYGLIEKWFVRQMDAPPRLKMKAPKAYAPSAKQSQAETVSSFFMVQAEFLRCIDAANGIDLSKTKVKNPVSRWLRFSLGQEIEFNAAHERRHLWQARRVKEYPDFPGA